MDKIIKTGSINKVKTLSFDAENFLKACEEKYKKSTKDFIKEYEENKLEKTSEFILWYKFAKES